MANYTFSGFDTVSLAEKYGTPLYVISQDIVENSINEIKRAFEAQNIDYSINYAGKAFLNIAMAKIVKNNKINLDVVSEGELLTALKAGLEPSKITLHGNNKTDSEITLAVNCGVGKIAIDSLDEIDRVNTIAKNLGKIQKVYFRVTPGVEAHTHEYIQTGKTDSKFGIPLSQALDAAKICKDASNIDLKGIHCHIGSSISAVEPFGLTMNVMLKLFYDIRSLGIDLTDINLGGGFGVVYMPGDVRFDVNAYTKILKDVMNEYINKNDDKTVPKICVEPGRFIISEAGITLYTVGTVKTIPGVRTYVSVDGSLADNPRPALYQAEYNAVIANKYDEKELFDVTVSGRACESDTLIQNIALPKCERGDIMAVFCTGAYNYSMASNYNRLAKPAVVLLKGDKSELMVRRQSFEEVLQNDVIPSWLED